METISYQAKFLTAKKRLENVELREQTFSPDLISFKKSPLIEAAFVSLYSLLDN